MVPKHSDDASQERAVLLYLIHRSKYHVCQLLIFLRHLLHIFVTTLTPPILSPSLFCLLSHTSSSISLPLLALFQFGDAALLN